jgi:hypothetical protein
MDVARADVPETAVQAVAERMFRRYESEYSAAHLSWRDFADDARADLAAAAPILAEAWRVTAGRKPGGTRDPRARIPCRRCGAQPGRQCVTSSGGGTGMVHAERRNDWRRAEGQTAGMMDPEGTNMDRFPPPKEVPGA